MGKDYKGTIIAESLTDPEVLNALQVISTRTDIDQDDSTGAWHLYSVAVDRVDIQTIQQCLKREGGWYMHFWNGNDIIVVFRDKMFELKHDDKTTWKEAIEYGLSVGVPLEQLDFLIE
jgi:hypothetical protein